MTRMFIRCLFVAVFLCFSLEVSAQDVAIKNKPGKSGGNTVLQPAAPATVNVSQERLQRVDAIIQKAIDKKEIAGAVGFIARNGKVIYNEAFGFADAPTTTPLRTDHIFRIASQSKAITSVAVMMLFEEGRFLLDDPISKYISAFSKPQVLDQYNASDTTYTTRPAKREVTIRDLLTHTSGLQYAVIGSNPWKAIYHKAGIRVGFEASPDSLRLVVDKLGALPLSHDPGEKFSYGLNTDVLGRLVEVVSGMPLDKFLQERIFQPLGMKDTYFYLPESKRARLVSVHKNGSDNTLIRYEGNGGVTTDYPTRNGVYLSGGAGLSSTIADYATFLQMLLNDGVYNGQRLLARRTVELMTANQIGDLFVKGSDKFGLGFQITTAQGQLKVGMSEGTFSWGGYFGTTYWVDPKEKIVALIYIQHSSLKSDVHDKFRASVYQALTD